MTTITTAAVPQRSVAKTWRFVATFVAGAAFAGGIAVGVGIADDSTPAPTHSQAIVQTHSAPADPGCLELRGLC